jgi:hypothetical protein
LMLVIPRDLRLFGPEGSAVVRAGGFLVAGPIGLLGMTGPVPDHRCGCPHA